VNEPPRLSPKSLQVLRLIAAGHSYSQIVDSTADLNYHDICFAAEDAVWLDERIETLAVELDPSKAEARPTGAVLWNAPKQTIRGRMPRGRSAKMPN